MTAAEHLTLILSKSYPTQDDKDAAARCIGAELAQVAALRARLSACDALAGIVLKTAMAIEEAAQE